MDVLSGNKLWLCASCFRCMDRCPRDVDFTEISIALRNLAARKGIMPEVYKEQALTIIETGYAFRISEARLKLRSKYGLPELPKSDVEQVNKLLDVVGLKNMIKTEGGK